MNWIRVPWTGQDGTIAEVFLSEDKSVIKKIYHPEGITVSGKKTRYPPDVIKACFVNEVLWTEKLQSKWVPRLIDISEETQTLIQEYNGPDLLNNYKAGTLHKDIPDIVEQIIDMYKFFKLRNVYKTNGSLSNMALKGKQVIAFDFKWAQIRPNWKVVELYSYTEWLSKIDKDLPEILEKLA